MYTNNLNRFINIPSRYDKIDVSNLEFYSNLCYCENSAQYVNIDDNKGIDVSLYRFIEKFHRNPLTITLVLLRCKKQAHIFIFLPKFQLDSISKNYFVERNLLYDNHDDLSVLYEYIKLFLEKFQYRIYVILWALKNHKSKYKIWYMVYEYHVPLFSSLPNELHRHIVEFLI